MSSVRLRRLEADYEAVRRLVHTHPKIELEGVSGNPPERYRFIMKVRSLRETGLGIQRIEEHKLEVRLPRGYPRDAPVCRMLTPVFHPNIAPHAVCVGDHWTAAESLAMLIMRVGEMLALQSYNVKSPLNGRAAQWVEEHVGELPIDAEEFFVDLYAELERAPDEAATCSNCGAKAGGADAVACGVGHLLCADCLIDCGTCGRVLCLTCGDAIPCAACAAAPAPEPDEASPLASLARATPTAASAGCANCGAAFGAEGAIDKCHSGHALCLDCIITCDRCGALLCLACGEPTCRTCPPPSQIGRAR